MSKAKNATVSPFFRELFQFGIYKRSQGRIARQVTGAMLALLIVLGAWQLGVYLQNHTSLRIGAVAIPAGLLAVGAWIAFRLVNYPSFADFLIAVEAEMNKVSWPTRSELIRSSVVVIMSILLLAFALFLFDSFWTFLFRLIHVIRH